MVLAPDSGSRKNWFRRVSECGHAQADSPQDRRQKSVITGASVLKTFACPVWTGFFVFLAAPIAAAIPIFYMLFTWLSIGYFARDKNASGFRTRQAWLILLLPFGVSLAAGGLLAGGAVILWSFLAPLIALLFHGPKASLKWLFGFVVVALASLFIEVFGLLPAVEMGPALLSVFTAMNVIVVAALSYAAVRYYALLLEEEQSAKEALNARIDGLEDEIEAARKAGSYRLMEQIGQGGMGEVWRAEHAMLARPAAVKLIRQSRLDCEQDKIDQVTQRFEREAQSTAALTSAHTVEVYDFGRTDHGDFYYVMELLNGLNLEDLVERFGPLESARVAYLLAQACDSLYEAHEVGLIHRDIKPANLFSCRRGNQYDVVKVLDFGLVKPFMESTSDSQLLTGDGGLAATPAYTSPESVLDPTALDGRSDIYLLGCVAYWLQTGSAPFEADTSFKMITKHAGAAPIPPSQRTEIDVDSELEAIILQCMEKDPNDRPADACKLRAALLPIAARGWDAERSRTWWELHHPLSLSTNAASASRRRSAQARFAARSGSQPKVTAGPDTTIEELEFSSTEISRAPALQRAD